MVRYTVVRLLLVVPMVLAVSLFIFWIGHVAPGDPLLTYMRQEGIQDIDPETYERLRHSLGLDRPVMVQWGDWLSRVVRGDLGKDLSSRRPVIDLIGYRLPISVQIGMAAFVLLAVGGIALGAVAAIKRDTWIDNLTVGGTLLINSFPVFVLAPMLLMVVVLWLGLIPSGFGWDGLLSPKAIMPVAILGITGWVGVVRLTRAGLTEVMGEDYVLAARAKGLPERMIVTRHILKNGLTGTLTSLGLGVAGIVTGSIFLEIVFGINGFGELAARSLIAIDVNMIMAVTLVSALLVIGANLLTDLLYGFLDPRVRYD